MTNREMVNKLLREEAERKLAVVETMTDAELVKATMMVRDWGIRIVPGNTLCELKRKTEGHIGNDAEVTEWLAKEFCR